MDIVSGKALANDASLSECEIPKFIFPGKGSRITADEDLKQLAALLGVTERKRNLDRYDLLVQWLSSIGAQTVRFEAKDRNSLDHADFCVAACKLFIGSNRVGVLVVRGCNQYWGKGPRDFQNREKLQILKGIHGLGKAHLVSNAGTVETINFSSGHRRLVVIQVPDFSLLE